MGYAVSVSLWCSICFCSEWLDGEGEEYPFGEVLRILETEYIPKNTFLWLLHSETVSLFSGVLERYDTIAHLFEFKNPSQKWAYKLLNPFSSFEANLKKSKRVICCEYNRAHITKAIYNLDKLPYILPNKPYNKQQSEELLIYVLV